MKKVDETVQEVQEARVGYFFPAQTIDGVDLPAKYIMQSTYEKALDEYNLLIKS